jgi:hypothetical protein
VEDAFFQGDSFQSMMRRAGRDMLGAGLGKYRGAVENSSTQNVAKVVATKGARDGVFGEGGRFYGLFQTSAARGISFINIAKVLLKRDVSFWEPRKGFRRGRREQGETVGLGRLAPAWKAPAPVGRQKQNWP